MRMKKAIFVVAAATLMLTACGTSGEAGNGNVDSGNDNIGSVSSDLTSGEEDSDKEDSSKNVSAKVTASDLTGEMQVKVVTGHDEEKAALDSGEYNYSFCSVWQSYVDDSEKKYVMFNLEQPDGVFVDPGSDFTISCNRNELSGDYRYQAYNKIIYAGTVVEIPIGDFNQIESVYMADEAGNPVNGTVYGMDYEDYGGGKININGKECYYTYDIYTYDLDDQEYGKRVEVVILQELENYADEYVQIFGQYCCELNEEPDVAKVIQEIALKEQQ